MRWWRGLRAADRAAAHRARPHALLSPRSARRAARVRRGSPGIKHGWVRVTFDYVMPAAVRDYVVAAVHLVAEHGWRLLPDYRFDPAAGQWRHRLGPAEPLLRLDAVRYGPDGEPAALPARATAQESVLAEHLAEARRILAERPEWTDDGGPPALSADFERLRWFALGAGQLA